MFTEAVRKKPRYLLKSVPGHNKTQDMCNEAMHITPLAFFPVFDPFMTHEMYISVFREMHVNCTMFLITSKPKWFVMIQYVKTLTLYNMFLIGLWRKRCMTIWQIMIIFTIMMSLLSRAMTINNVSLRGNKQKKILCSLLDIPREFKIGALQRMRRKELKK